MSRMPLPLAFAALVLTACQALPDGDAVGAGWGDELATTSQAITVDHEAVLTFQADWNVIESHSPVKAGGTLKVVYDPQRLPNCRATKYGMQAWSILMYYQTPGKAATYVPLSGQGGGMMTATIAVPEEATSLTLWFFNNDYYGCKEYDSNLGANYVYPVSLPVTAAQVVFAGGWTESALSPITQGGAMQIAYAPARLRACRYAPGGARAWNIFASWRFEPGGQTGTVALFEGDLYGGEAAVLQPVVIVPAEATGVELWFSNSDATGCVAWDSAFGANYPFPVTPPDATGPQVGWAGDYDFVTATDTQAHLGNVDPAYYFDSWAGVPKASWVEVQVWIPGVTDQAYGSQGDLEQAATGSVTAEVVSDALPDGDGWGTRALRFERQQGNNFVYSFRLGELRWGIYDLNVPDGLYHYTFRFSTDGGATWFEVGEETGEPRRFVVDDALDCSLFPDSAPASCPKDLAVGWAGNWGRYVTHACYHEPGVPDPVVFTKSAAGHDCMTLTAEVWVEGLTDKGGAPSAILAQVRTDVGYSGGPLGTPVTYPLAFDGKVGNNYRYAWHVEQHVGMVDRDDYTYQFRFSADGGKTWKTLANEDHPDKGWRDLHVRLDSTDVEAVEFCDGLQTWSNPSNSYPACVAYQPDLNASASYCELYVNALGDGQWSHTGATMQWLEAYVKTPPQEGVVLNVGMWTRYADEGGAEHEIVSLGSQIEPDYWLTGFTYAKSSPGAEAMATWVTVEAFAFFVDVLRTTGDVDRLWQSNGGANYTLADTFAVPGYSKGIGSGDIEYADESVPLFDQKHACGW